MAAVVVEAAEPEVVVEEVKENEVVVEGRWDALLKQHFGAEWVNARKVMMCESGGREKALGDTHLTYWKAGREWGSSAGLFQIRDLPGRPEQAWLMNGENNIQYAAQMQREQGWQPWSCARKLVIN